MQGIDLQQPAPEIVAKAETTVSNAAALAHRHRKATEQKKECYTAITSSIKRTDAAIGKVRHEYHHDEHKAE